MIYFVSGRTELFNNSIYKLIGVDESLLLLNSFNKIAQYDSETFELDPHLGKLLLIQFGNIDKSIQIVVDATTVDIIVYKEVLETFFLIGHNLDFDLKWLFNKGIVPLRVYDTMIAEQLIYLSYPHFAIGISEDLMFRYKDITSVYPNWKNMNTKEKKAILYSKDSELADFIYNHSGASLKAVAYRYLGIEMDKSVRGQIQYKGITDDVIVYSANDVVPLYDIMQHQLKILKERNMINAVHIECNFVPCNAYYEWCGVMLDVPKWEEKIKEDTNKRDTALAKLNQFVIDFDNPKFIYVDNNLFTGFTKICNINWNSNKQVIPFLEALGFNCKGLDKETKEEKDSMQAKILKSQKGINDEFLKVYFDYTEANKVCSTYGKAYINAVNPKTHRIHTQFRQLGTDTGRLACGSQQINTALAKLKHLPLTRVKDTSKICAYPQLQNLPNDELTRSCFIAAPGNDFVSIDYNSEESRLLASLSNDKAMLDVFIKGYDMHSMVAYMIYPDKIPRDIDIKSIKSKYHDLRQSAKGPEFTFAFLGNADTLVANYGMPKEEAQGIEDNYKKGFYGATQYQEKCKKFVERNGYITICKETNHRAYWWDWKWWKKQQASYTHEFWEEYPEHKKNKDLIWSQVREHFKALNKWHKNGVNSTTQGLGSVIFKIFNRLLLEWIIKNNLFGKVRFCVPVHDEICIECPKENTKEVVDKVKELMSYAGELFCHRLPMPAEEEVGKYWKH